MLQKVLIANRNEIAIRIMRACRELQIPTVAVYTEADRASRHLTMADQALLLPGGSYLNIDDLIAIAKQAGADSIHPGYGFLSENADFAGACVDAGLTWIGPHPQAIRDMGSKTLSRRIAESANVPLVPGISESITDPEVILAFAQKHGYPVAIKASAGGGGRGIQIVQAPEEVPAALAKAIREGEAYFKSGEVFVERYLTRPRHIEFQILGDKHGQYIHLGERECSIQRRNQKLIEEAPSPVMTPELRDRMGRAAVSLAKRVGYDSAGTVEFLYQDGEFYFLEMNTRIQVEHPITEWVYGVDLVKEQLRIAGGEKISPYVLEAKPRGWAIECRINAEDPSANFRPTPGLISDYQQPGGPGIRMEAGLYSGYRVPDQYDSLLAKLTAWGHNREEALTRILNALDELKIEGIPTTIPFHKLALRHPAFQQGDLSTRFIGEALLPEDLKGLAQPPTTPADAADAQPTREFEVEVNREHFRVAVREIGGQAVLTSIKVKAKKKKSQAVNAIASGQLTAPMQAVVKQIGIEVGQPVQAGQVVLILEAMKMENEIAAPVSGVLKAVHVTVGQTVEAGILLAEIEESK